MNGPRRGSAKWAGIAKKVGKQRVSVQAMKDAPTINDIIKAAKEKMSQEQIEELRKELYETESCEEIKKLLDERTDSIGDLSDLFAATSECNDFGDVSCGSSHGLGMVKRLRITDEEEKDPLEIPGPPLQTSRRNSVEISKIKEVHMSCKACGWSCILPGKWEQRIHEVCRE
jgi:hypothetical protein